MGTEIVIGSNLAGIENRNLAIFSVLRLYFSENSLN